MTYTGKPRGIASYSPEKRKEWMAKVRAAREGKPRGTAAMSPAVRREVARKGGLAAAAKPGYMAELGRRGGLACSKDREHMARIGRIGGTSSGQKRAAQTECRNGHPRLEENVYVTPQGVQICRVCRKSRQT